mgnify:CR=1 FL=1|jgi:2',5'-phosphodiesterase
MVRRSSRTRKTTSKRSNGGPDHNFVSYNVLCSHLAGPNHFRYCKPEFLDRSYRLSLILKKLEAEISKDSVIALQEIGQEWAGDLHSFFSERGYYFVCRHYGSRFNDYMGVGIAVPTSQYEIMEMNNKRVADTLWMPRLPKPHRLVSLIMGFINFFTRIIFEWMMYLGLAKKPHDLWDHVSARWNILCGVKLRHRASDEQFWVTTYHMPCAFRNPDMMLVHASLALQHTQKLAGLGEQPEGKEREILPYVLLGDFNFKPSDGMYELYMNGTISSSHSCYPEIPERLKWVPDVEPVRSAYLEASGEEPEYTNNARVQEQDPFKETLDYIFVSDKWNVRSVRGLNLPPKEEQDHPFPDEVEPSDHVLIAATLTL